ncbi:MAG TPA: phospholipase D-like domain-containing protein [Terriglobales bacterium]|nr:phospholipase D-like domain-containing protein [Terriglobales bacterium]
MASRKSSSVAVLLALLALGAYSYHQFQLERHARPLDAAPPGQVLSENHFSPGENLERLDVDRLRSAQQNVDIAMYAFTDKYIAETLVGLAQRGVRIRLYRDRSQYQQEQENAARYRDASTTDMLRGQTNIQIRVKASGRRDLMHLKSYVVDGTLLRDGSANWSAAGLKRQDNNAHFTNDPAQVRAFQQAFEAMWEAETNEIVQ